MEDPLNKFKEGVTNFQSVLTELTGQLENEREQLRQQQEQLRAEKEKFEEECRRVKSVVNEGQQVYLNVGGYKFTTTVTTLKNAPSPSLFNAMFSGRHALRPDDSGCYFIDRDGRHFHDILNFLRDGQFSYPHDGTDFKYLLEVRAEAEFYGLEGLVQQIDRYPYSLIKVQRVSSYNMDDNWMYEDGQDEVVFTVDKRCQLLGVGLCGTEGGFTVELEVLEVHADDFSQEISKLQEVAQSYTKQDGQLLKLFLPSPPWLEPNHYYMLSALVRGAESYCCDDCLDCVVAGGVKVQFHCWESPNGTNEQRGQFPELYIRVL